MGNCQSSVFGRCWTQTVTCCRRCSTYSVATPERNPAVTDLPLAEREPATLPEQPSVDVQPPVGDSGESLPKPEALTSDMLRLPKPLAWRNSLSIEALSFFITSFYLNVVRLKHLSAWLREILSDAGGEVSSCIL